MASYVLEEVFDIWYFFETVGQDRGETRTGGTFLWFTRLSIPLSCSKLWKDVDGSRNRYDVEFLFEEPYWLDCVAPGDWHAVELKQDGQIIGRLPYFIKRRYGVSAISTPWFTPWLGPWIRAEWEKAAKRAEPPAPSTTNWSKGFQRYKRRLSSALPSFKT